MTEAAPGFRREPDKVLETYRLIPDRPLYQLGCFEKGVTIFKQQARALNFTWALTKSESLRASSDPGRPRPRIAIIGGGFAGLTAAAALIKMQADVDITIFERRDTLLPYQYGCDTRWLHPRIYDWPNKNSTIETADLPVLHWTAGRASDVVVEVLRQWREIVEDATRMRGSGTLGVIKEERGEPDGVLPVEVFCNLQYLTVSPTSDENLLALKWVGSPRQVADPSLPAGGRRETFGRRKNFNHVILAVGYGLEKEHWRSYWRNETFAQPHLGQARATYIVSGFGDSALIDLLRLRIAHFRQDRILDELFGSRREAKEALRKYALEGNVSFDGLSDLLIEGDGPVPIHAKAILRDLGDRIRNDTFVILHLAGGTDFTNIFSKSSTSFHNRLLTFLLFHCGGFIPYTGDLVELAKEHSVPPDRVLRRHGTNRSAEITGLLADSLIRELRVTSELSAKFSNPVEAILNDSSRRPQEVDLLPDLASYFSAPGTNIEPVSPIFELIADSLCSTIASYFSIPRHRARVSVTLWRTWGHGRADSIQQCCRYLPDGFRSSYIGRVVPMGSGVVGLACAYRRIIRTKPMKKPLENGEEFRRNLSRLDGTNRHGSNLYPIASVAAVPLLSRDDEVLGALYVDSDKANLFTGQAGKTHLKAMHSMCAALLSTVEAISRLSRDDSIVETSSVSDGEVAGLDESPWLEKWLRANPPKTTSALAKLDA